MVELQNIKIFQGGMGVDIANWKMARAAALWGIKHGMPTMGIVSNTGRDIVYARALQDGDPGGHYRRASKHFPNQRIVDEVWSRYYIEGGKPSDKPYKAVPVATFRQSRQSRELIALAGGSEIWLAKEGHDGPIGVNFLTEVQAPMQSELAAVMAEKVDAVVVGAGIPLQFPDVMDDLAAYRKSRFYPHVEAGNPKEFEMLFDPRDIFPESLGVELRRPWFIPIVSTPSLAKSIIKSTKSGDGEIRVDGCVVELYSAGGHNAPPRGKPIRYNERREPQYGPRDEMNEAKWAEMRELGIPFWGAGAFARPERLKELIEKFGANGGQFGSIFAMTEESGYAPWIKAELRRLGYLGILDVLKDGDGSPSSFPFNEGMIPGTIAIPEVYAERDTDVDGRICDLERLRHMGANRSGDVIMYCPSEPVEDYVRKRLQRRDTNALYNNTITSYGRTAIIFNIIAETKGKKCLCNHLLSAAGKPQVRKWGVEKAIVTIGDDVGFLPDLINSPYGFYFVDDALNYLTSEIRRLSLTKPQFS